MQLERFVAAGSCRDKELLTNTLKFILESNREHIYGFRMDSNKYNEGCTSNSILVLTSSPKASESTTKYPFEIRYDNEGIGILTSHILEYISNFSDDDLEQFGEEVTGYEEDYEIGWEVFIPDWYTAEHGIDNYSILDVLAVRPVKLEYGK